LESETVQGLKPPRLKNGDLIALVSPASTPSPREKIDASVRYLEKLGYRVKVGRHAGNEYGYLAGTDAERAADFNEMLRDQEVKAVFALRGGYGTPRILPLIDYETLRRHPKIISGFSDITALQLAIYQHTGLITFSGPMPAVEFWKNPDPFTEENFWRLLSSSEETLSLPNPPDDPARTLCAGIAEGVLLGGNLSLVTSSIGTRFLPSFRGAILALEEVDEVPYRVDRMLAQITNSGIARQIAGLLLGKFTHCEPKDPAKPSLATDQLLSDFAAAAKIPAITNLAYGHVPRKMTLPFGARVRIEAVENPRIQLLENAVE
jgi:muramoyltetrapeptide carboxypeptidase